MLEDANVKLASVAPDPLLPRARDAQRSLPRRRPPRLARAWIHRAVISRNSHTGIQDPQLLEPISDALDELATHDPALAEIIDVKFFCGLSTTEIAAMRRVFQRTVKYRAGNAPASTCTGPLADDILIS